MTPVTDKSSEGYAGLLTQAQPQWRKGKQEGTAVSKNHCFSVVIAIGMKLPSAIHEGFQGFPFVSTAESPQLHT